MLRTNLLNPNPNLSASKLLVLETKSGISSYCTLLEKRRVNSERVVSFFKTFGFSDDHITQITSSDWILFADPQKNLAPKFDFFRSLGMSDTDLVKIISYNPHLLKASLENQLIPCHHYLKSLFHSDENVVKVIKRSCMSLNRSVGKILAPNISLLRDVGFTVSRIQFVVMQRSGAIQCNYPHFKSKVEEVISLGFDPMKLAFVDALSLLCVLNKTTFDRKWTAFRKANLSDDDIRAAFRAFPNCMSLSEEKITRNVDFLVNKMGFKAARIIASPISIVYSLEKRIIPRCRVIKVLQSHGFIKKDIGLTTFLGPSETKFLNKFVSEYEDEVPGLLKIYKQKMDC